MFKCRPLKHNKKAKCETLMSGKEKVLIVGG